MGGEWSEAKTAVAVDAVEAMVGEFEPSWSVTDVSRSEQGTDFVGLVDVDTDGEGPDRAVLKATTAEFVDPVVARSEPRFFELLAERTDVPVPSVYGYCDDHDEFPAPFYLVEYVPGETFESDVSTLWETAIRRVLADAGANLAELHDLRAFDAVGDVGVLEDGTLGLLDTDAYPATTGQRAWLRESALETIDALEDGGYFPEMADDRGRFADLLPALRDVVREQAADIPEPAPPRYCHWDYRFGNLRIDPETGATNAVLDWANCSVTDPAYNLAKVETPMVDANDPTESVREGRRDTFRSAYEDARETCLDPNLGDDWRFEEAVRERMRFYRLIGRLDAMACLPLWHREKTPAERDAVEAEHRDALEPYR